MKTLSLARHLALQACFLSKSVKLLKHSFILSDYISIRLKIIIKKENATHSCTSHTGELMEKWRLKVYSLDKHLLA